MITPKALTKGAHVRIVAPSSPFDRALLLRGAALLGTRYRVSFADSLFERSGYLAGDDERRLRELDGALQDPSVHAIVAARGGYGASRIASAARFAALREHPKWLVGFSDITALHVEAGRVEVASVHAHHAAGLGRFHDRRWLPWLTALEAPEAPRLLCGSRALGGGRGEGTLIGGNLSVWHACWAAGRVRLPRRFVVAFEDVGESSYRIDRMLTSLRTAGLFDKASAVALGQFSECSPGRYGVSVEQAILDALKGLACPVLLGLPFGHGEQNEPLIFGHSAHVDTSTLSLSQAHP